MDNSSLVDDEAKAKQQATLDKLQKENNKMRIKLAKATKANMKGTILNLDFQRANSF